MTWLHRSGVGVVVAFMVACGSDPARVPAPATEDETACDRECLIELAREVATGTSPLDASTRLTENGTEAAFADTWLARASDVDVHGEYADAERQEVIVAGSGTDRDGRPTVFGLRLRREVTTGSTAAEITEAELIMTHEGEVSLFPPSIPLARHAVFGEVLPTDRRTSPERMIEIANAYFDGIEVDSGVDVPITEDCARIENGVQTTNSERFPNLQCNSLAGFDYITEVRERRFPVVDEERGVVVAHVAFYIPGGDYERTMNGMTTTRHYDPRALFLIEAFKIEAGKVRTIEATMRNMPLGATMGWPEAS